ncbi:MAG: hypothetical protein AB7L65_09480, partial [Hyphomonadaceae bacterium]
SVKRNQEALIKALICAAALAFAAAAAAAETPDPFNLSIEIGRWGVMQGQIDAVAPPGQPALEEEGAPSPAALARRLRETVWELNLQRSRLCAEGRFTEIACAPAFSPPWLREAPDRSVSLSALQRRSEAVGRALMPLWGAACADARAEVEDEEEQRLICAIE